MLAVVKLQGDVLDAPDGTPIPGRELAVSEPSPYFIRYQRETCYGVGHYCTRFPKPDSIHWGRAQMPVPEGSKKHYSRGEVRRGTFPTTNRPWLGRHGQHSTRAVKEVQFGLKSLSQRALSVGTVECQSGIP